MSRPKTDTNSSYDVAFQFMLEKHGPRSLPQWWPGQWEKLLDLVIEVIEFDRERRGGKEKP